MAEQLNCTIEADFSFMQTDCHWKLERFFRLTWDKADGKELYYGLGTYTDTRVLVDKVYEENNSYVYELPLSAFTAEELVSARDDQGWLTITVSCNGKQKTFDKFYILELPPKFSTNTINMGLVTDNPGEIKVSWQQAIERDNSDAENSPDSLDGYNIEVFHCPANLDATKAENFTRIKDLHWKDEDPITGMPTTGVYKLVKVSDTVEPINETEGEEDILTFVGPGTDFEVRIENPLTHEFYFNPKHLGLKPGDSYKFVIYPYSHYEGSLIAPQGAESSIGKVPKGIVRVRTADSWVEGQVWVYTTKGWVQAEAVYTKIDSGWKETQ